MTRTIAATLVAFLAVAVSQAHADNRDTEFFREMDVNGDGFIDREEFTLRKGVILYMLDANHDLKISRNETKLPPDVFKEYAGPDGTIDGGELFNMKEVRFAAFDKNDDGKISYQEFRQQLAEVRAGPQAAEQR